MRVGDRDVVGLQALDRGGDELGDAAHRAGVERVGRVAEHDGGRGRRRRRRRTGRPRACTSWTCGAGDALDAADRAGDLALQRALVGDLLLEVGGAELLLVEQLEALAASRRVEADARAGERDARLGDRRLVDREGRAVVAQLVGDACSSSAAVNLPVCARVEARRQRSCTRAPWRSSACTKAMARIATVDTATMPLERAGKRAEGIDEGRHESAQTWVWKMSWAASTAFVRICEASCIASCARSTAITTAVGSDAWPVASACEAVAGLGPGCQPTTAATCRACRRSRRPVCGASACAGSTAERCSIRGRRPRRRDRWEAASAEEVERLGEHLLGRLHRRDVRLIGALTR